MDVDGARTARWCVVGVLLFGTLLLSGDGVVGAQSDDDLLVAAFEVEPYVVRRGDVAGGFMFEVWDNVATELGWQYDVVWIDSLDDLGEVVANGDVDVAIAPLSSTVRRERQFDFTSTLVASGPKLGVHRRSDSPVTLVGALFSGDVLRLLIWSAIGLLVLGHLMWLVDRRSEASDFRPGYRHGVWDGVWWATVTVTTVGYGDTSPKTPAGRVVAIVAMVGSLFLLGAFVSEVTTSLQRERSAKFDVTSNGLDGRPVAVVEGSRYERFLQSYGVDTVGYPNQADVFAAAEDGTVDLVVADEYTLEALGGDYGIHATGDVLFDEFIGFGVRENSPLRDEINGVLSILHEEGRVSEIVERWTG